MAFEKIKDLLKETIGLSSESIGNSSIERAIGHRKYILKIMDENSYYSLLKENKDELDELVEEVVVPETWFFRNLVPFEILSGWVRDVKKFKYDGKTSVKILSMPCSTGEEPYSIAMTLLENGLTEDQFKIDAQDISRRAIRKARRAIYGKNSFREATEFSIDKYFNKTNSGQQLLPIVRDRVNFIQANIIKDMRTSEQEYYDVIFCRNLLIYFDRKTQKEAIEKIYFMLKPGGILFVGHAETSGIEKGMFTKINSPKAFAYQKNIISTNIINHKDTSQTELLKSIYDNLVVIARKDAEIIRKSRDVKYTTVRKNKDDKEREITIWDQVRMLIEDGNMRDASVKCEEQLKHSANDAQAYYYLALISKMEGSFNAAELLLKKAIYLDPDHHKALSLFSLLADQRGDGELAETLRRREVRARNRTDSM